MIALQKTALSFLAIVASLAISGASSNAQAQGSQLPLAAPGSPITFEALDVTNPDASKCVYGWTAQVHNSSNKDLEVVVSAFFGSAKAGESKVVVPAHESIVASAKDVVLTSGTANASSFAFQVRAANENKFYASKYQKTPMLTNWFGLEMSAKTASPSTFTWAATNPSSFAFPANDLAFQGYVASSANGPWTTGAGGTIGKCIPAHGSVSMTANKPQGATHARVDVLVFGYASRKEVVEIAPLPSAKVAAVQGPIPQ